MPDRELERHNPARVPTSIGPIEIALYDHDGVPANMGASAVVRVLDQDDLIITPHQRADDIRGVLSSTEKQQLKAIIDKIRARANTLILGGS